MTLTVLLGLDGRISFETGTCQSTAVLYHTHNIHHINMKCPTPTSESDLDILLLSDRFFIFYFNISMDVEIITYFIQHDGTKVYCLIL